MRNRTDWLFFRTLLDPHHRQRPAPVKETFGGKPKIHGVLRLRRCSFAGSTDVCRHAAADRPPACAASIGMRATWADATNHARRRPKAGRATNFSTSARSTGGFGRLPRRQRTICGCTRRPEGRFSSPIDPESRECRAIALCSTTGRPEPSHNPSFTKV